MFLFLFIAPIYSDEINLSLELDDIHYTEQNNNQPSIATVFSGDTFQLKTVVSGNKQKGEPVSIEGLSNFTIIGPLSISSRVTSINNETKAQNTVIYPLQAKQEGMFTIGPATLIHNGATISSNSLQLLVVPQHKRHKVKITSAPQLVKKAETEQAVVFSKINVNKKEAYLGEPIILEAHIYTKDTALQVGSPELPRLQHFTVKEIKDVTAKKETINNTIYTTYRKLFVLFPTEEGTLPIDPIQIQYSVRAKPSARRRGFNFFEDDFFAFTLGRRTERKKAFSNSTSIQIKSLPEYSEELDSIGTFENFQATVDKRNVMVNEPIKLILNVKGKGDLDQITPLKLSLPTGVKSYESTSSIQEDLSTQYYGGTKQFEYVVQIPFGGTCIIPKQSFTYFDTVNKLYKTLQTKPITIMVTAPIKAVTTQSNKIEESKTLISNEKPKPLTKTITKDINFIEETLTTSSTTNHHIPLWAFSVFILLIPVALFRIKIKILLIPLTSKLIKSRKMKLSAFQDKFNNYIDSNKPEKLYGLFITLFAKSFKVPQSIINEDWIEQKLRKYNLEDEQIELFIKYLNQCAQLTFASKQISKDMLENLSEHGSYWLSTIYQLINSRNCT